MQIGSALGSVLGQCGTGARVRLRMLVACGAAGGISATFNAPIAGVFFALELILRDFEAESFGVVVLASVVADVIGRAAFGSHPFLHLPGFELRSPVEYPLYAVLGVLAALVGVAFIRVLYGSEDLADRLWRGPRVAAARPPAASCSASCCSSLPAAVRRRLPAARARDPRAGTSSGSCSLLLVGKIVATSLTHRRSAARAGSSPRRCSSARCSGRAYGAGVHALLPGMTAPAGTYGLVGMGAVFAAAARAPITAVIIIFELTGDYRIILPLMFAIVLAAGAQRLLSRDTIYTLKLRRRGIDISRQRGVNLMRMLTVAQAMQPLPEALASDTPLEQAIARLAESGADGLPVVDERGSYLGTITSRTVEQAMHDGTIDETIGPLAHPTPVLSESQPLEDALDVLLRSHSGLPVAHGDDLTGWLTHLDVLRAYHDRLQRGRQSTGSTGPKPLPLPRRSGRPSSRGSAACDGSERSSAARP